VTTLSDSRPTLPRWRVRFLAIELALLIVLLLAGLGLAPWESRVLLVDIYMVLGFALLLAWVFILIGHRSQLTSLRAALIPCWLPFIFILIWMIFTLFSN
jgi:hypothetical protein